jgi:hypothetical protein
MCRFVGTMWSEIEESESEREEPINQTKISIKETEIVITDRARRKAEVEMGMGIANWGWGSRILNQSDLLLLSLFLFAWFPSQFSPYGSMRSMREKCQLSELPLDVIKVFKRVHH